MVDVTVTLSGLVMARILASSSVEVIIILIYQTCAADHAAHVFVYSCQIMVYGSGNMLLRFRILVAVPYLIWDTVQLCLSKDKYRMNLDSLAEHS